MNSAYTDNAFADTLYTDEPIRLADADRAAYTPPRIRAMRKIGARFDTEAKIFWQQGLFMADFEDDFDFRGAVIQYYPTYRALMDAQLRGYFSWRTKVRRGDVQRTSLSFAFLYAYELLNRIGVDSPEEGFRTLRAFWEAYRQIDARLDSYLPIWLRDYAVYHDLDASCLAGLPDEAFDASLAVLLDYENRDAAEVFTALNSLSAYDLEKSRYFAKHPDEAQAAAVRVFAAVSKYYNRKDADAAREKLFGRLTTSGYTMFRSAVFHHRLRQENRVYALSGFHRYICTGNVWTCERFVGYGANNRKIGEILRETDYLLRESGGFPSALKPGKLNKTLKAKIAKEIAAFRAEEEAREKAKNAVRIDASKLGAIRASALKTQQRLLVDEEEEQAPEFPFWLSLDTVIPRTSVVSGKLS